MQRCPFRPVRPRRVAPGLFALAIALSIPAPARLPAQSSARKRVETLAALLARREGTAFWDTVTRLETLGREAVPALLAQLDAGSERVRLGCAKAILRIGRSKTQEQAVAALGRLIGEGKKLEVRVAALELYGENADPDDAVERLTPLLRNATEPRLSVPVARALWEIDHVAAAREFLVDRLGSRDPAVRADSALALAEIGYADGRVREVLRGLREEPTERGRRARLLDRLERANRQLDSRLESGELLIEGTDATELLKVKEERIRALEERLGQLADSGAGGAPAARAKSAMDRLLEETIDIVQKYYVDASKTSRDDLLLAAVKGMVHSLDPHSVFFEPQASRDFGRSLRGEYPGIGTQVVKRPNGPLEILRPIYKGPAYRAGILSGDLIIEVDGRKTADLDMERITELLRGEEGSPVTLEIWRRGWTEPREFRLRRETIEVPSVYPWSLPEGVGYLRVTQFGDKTAQEFVSALESLEEGEEGGLRGLVIDLRGNPGGRLEVAVRITDLFVRGPLPIVTQKGRADTSDKEERVYPTDEARTGYPIVVLVDENSASASEIVSGALQDHGRATIVGRRTFGKGTVQRLIGTKSLPGGRLKLTVQYYFLPLDRCIHTIRDAQGRVVKKGGVEPDVVVTPWRVPAWRAEERSRLRVREEILAYVDRHSRALASLVPLGDRGKEDAYPEFEKLYESLQTRAPREDVRAVILSLVTHHVEDARGYALPFSFPEDVQLQVAVRELLTAMGRDADRSDAYRWLAHAPEAEAEASAGTEAEAGSSAGAGGDAPSPEPAEQASPSEPWPEDRPKDQQPEKDSGSSEIEPTPVEPAPVETAHPGGRS